MSCSRFLVLLIHLGPWSLKESWHVYKIAEPVISIGVAFLVLASSDRSGIFLISDIIVSNDFQTVWEVVENEETG